MSDTAIREQVTRAAGTYARQYPSVVDDVVAAIDATGSVEGGKARLRDLGYGTYAYLLDAVSLPTVDSTITEAIDSFGPLDMVKEQACDVIRAFLVGEEDMPEEDVTALLVIAGLEAEVVPEPEPEVEDDRSILRRLVDWAKGQGFSG